MVCRANQFCRFSEAFGVVDCGWWRGLPIQSSGVMDDMRKSVLVLVAVVLVTGIANPLTELHVKATAETTSRSIRGEVIVVVVQVVVVVVVVVVVLPCPSSACCFVGRQSKASSWLGPSLNCFAFL